MLPSRFPKKMSPPFFPSVFFFVSKEGSSSDLKEKLFLEKMLYYLETPPRR